jgi:hypothetical protein
MKCVLIRLGLVAAVALVALTGCSTGLRIQSAHVPAGSLRLAQIMWIGTGQDMQKPDLQPTRAVLTDSGVSDTELKDGGVVVSRIECCGGPNEESSAIVIYVPPSVKVQRGDIVELRAADPAKKGQLGQVNVVTRIVQQAGDPNGTIRWNPPDQRLWCRTLYADWMRQEGWKYQGGLYKAWYKPAP